MREICEEANRTHTISHIVASEREELARLYEYFTKHKIDCWCEACVYQAALTVYHRTKKEA